MRSLAMLVTAAAYACGRGTADHSRVAAPAGAADAGGPSVAADDLPATAAGTSADAGASASDAGLDAGGASTGPALSELPSLEGNGALLPSGINGRGDVVGTTVVASPAQPQAFFFDGRTKKIHWLDAPGTVAQSATAINAQGAVAGWVLRSAGATQQRRAVRWDHGQVTELAPLPTSDAAPDSAAAAINDQGVIGGWSMVSGLSHAVLWTAGGVRDLASGAMVTALNSSGVAAGTFWGQPGTGAHAAVFADGGVRDLGTLPGTGYAQATAINDSGRVIGFAWAAATAGDYHSFIDDLPQGPMRELHEHSAAADAVPNHQCTLYAVNSAGTAVGSCSRGTASDRQVSAVVLRAGASELAELNTLVQNSSWDLRSASAINDAGQIAGFGYHDGQPRGFVLNLP